MFGSITMTKDQSGKMLPQALVEVGFLTIALFVSKMEMQFYQ